MRVHLLVCCLCASSETWRLVHHGFALSAYMCVSTLPSGQLSMYLSEAFADSANQQHASSARSRCTCQAACPACKCRKIVCLSEARTQHMPHYERLGAERNSSQRKGGPQARGFNLNRLPRTIWSGRSRLGGGFSAERRNESRLVHVRRIGSVC